MRRRPRLRYDVTQEEGANENLEETGECSALCNVMKSVEVIGRFGPT